MARVAFWRSGNGFDLVAFVAEASEASYEKGKCIDESESLLASLVNFVARELELNESPFSFVGNIRELAASNVVCVCLEWLEDLKLLFTMEEHHGIEVGHARRGGEGL